METRNSARALFSSAAIAALVIFSTGCAGHASSSAEAIQHAKAMRTPQQQSDYLVKQAREFLASRDYQEAVKTVNYVLASVDSRSEQAKQVLEQAKGLLARDTQAAVGEARARVGL